MEDPKNPGSPQAAPAIDETSARRRYRMVPAVTAPVQNPNISGSIYHVHAKDCFINPNLLRLNGVLDAKPYAAFSGRTWNFRTVGYGHDIHIWKNIISALAETGYDGVISIEHEDALMTREEGLEKAVSLLSEVIIQRKNELKWWELREEG
jgi:hypothetical protein